ncbi:hypothetical protein EVAR_98980_1 [Eumeta japonica]|uniref:Uncharacterized protein n=1 Tax=Eumeta variegata TaxID=151549 RepID=A0A4C1YSX2_EUMVA|nr:hypothetical protein EVAR_98980_1 [Eumeta japonica]
MMNQFIRGFDTPIPRSISIKEFQFNVLHSAETIRGRVLKRNANVKLVRQSVIPDTYFYTIGLSNTNIEKRWDQATLRPQKGHLNKLIKLDLSKGCERVPKASRIGRVTISGVGTAA